MVNDQILLSILEFIALALPAIAILMQVIIQFRDKYGPQDLKGIPLEFRFLEIAFLLLVVGGSGILILFALTIDSILLIGSTSLVVLALPAIGLSMWIMVRQQPGWEAREYEHPADLLRDAFAQFGVGTVILIPLGILTYIFLLVVVIFVSNVYGGDQVFNYLPPEVIALISVALLLFKLVQVYSDTWTSSDTIRDNVKSNLGWMSVVLLMFFSIGFVWTIMTGVMITALNHIQEISIGSELTALYVLVWPISGMVTFIFRLNIE